MPYNARCQSRSFVVETRLAVALIHRAHVAAENGDDVAKERHLKDALQVEKYHERKRQLDDEFGPIVIY